MSKSERDGYTILIAESVLARVQAMGREISGVFAAEDIEYVHRMRVASRRLRSALALADGHLPAKRVEKWLASTKRVTRALGAARDKDVQLAFVDRTLAGLTDNRLLPGVRRLRLRLKQARDESQAAVKLELERLDESAVLDEMNTYMRDIAIHGQLRQVSPRSASACETAAAFIRTGLAEMLFYERYVRDPEAQAELHAMRIAAKRLRYAIEIFGPLFDKQLDESLASVREVQDALGELHDCVVWAEYIPRFIAEERQRVLDFYGDSRNMPALVPGLDYLREDRLRERQARYRAFVKMWESLRRKGVWESLPAALRPPLEPAAEDCPIAAGDPAPPVFESVEDVTEPVETPAADPPTGADG